MPRRVKSDLGFGSENPPNSAPQDLPTWTNVLVTDDMPIRWTTEVGEPWPGDELAGRLVIGQEEQLVIDLCGTAVTRLLAVLVGAHHGADALHLMTGAESAVTGAEEEARK